MICMVVGVHADESGERCDDPTTARPSIDGDRARLRGRFDRARPRAGTVVNHDAGHSDRGNFPAALLLDSRRRQRIKAHLLVHGTAEPARVEYGRALPAPPAIHPKAVGRSSRGLTAL